MLVGAGAPAAEIIQVIREHPAYDLAGVLDPAAGLKGTRVHGVEALGWLDELPAGEWSAVIGQPAQPDAFDREAVFHILARRGIPLPGLRAAGVECHPTATIGHGVILLHDSRVEAGATIGADCLLGPGCDIGPDSAIPEHTVVPGGRRVTPFDVATPPPLSPRSLAAVTATGNDTIRTVIRRINRSRMEIVMIVADDGALRGVITDGDIRRGILAGLDLDSPADGVMNRNPVCAPADASRAAILALMKAHSIRHVPVVDDRGRPVRIEALQALVGAPRGAGAVIMAGGSGTRLRPLTDKVPKPLVSVAGKPILDHLLGGVHAAGIRDVAISVNYLADAVRNHVGTGRQYGLNVNYLAEKDRLGTAGALSLMNPRPAHSFLVLNGDVLTDLNFDRMLGFHEEHAYDIVMCVRKYETRIPYGVVDIRDGRIVGLHEKPVHTDFINAGVYVLRPECLDLVPRGRSDMTDLVNAVLARGGTVGAFPVIEYWRDIGTPGDLSRATLEQQNLKASVTLQVEEEQSLEESA